MKMVITIDLSEIKAGPVPEEITKILLDYAKDIKEGNAWPWRTLRDSQCNPVGDITLIK